MFHTCFNWVEKQVNNTRIIVKGDRLFDQLLRNEMKILIYSLNKLRGEFPGCPFPTRDSYFVIYHSRMTSGTNSMEMKLTR
jgi:hypothetical protein